MVVKKKPMMYLDVTDPTAEYHNLINNKNEVVGKVSAKDYLKNPEKYMNDPNVTPFQYTGWRKKKDTKSKSKRKKKDCGCK
jgi:hypothetical protein